MNWRTLSFSSQHGQGGLQGWAGGSASVPVVACFPLSSVLLKSHGFWPQASRGGS